MGFQKKPVVLLSVVSSLVVRVTLAGVVDFEGADLPEALGWERVTFGDCVRDVDAGTFSQLCRFRSEPVPANGQDFYRRSVADFAGEEAFFLEWRVETSAPPWILTSFSGTPTGISAFGNGNANYHFTITDGLVRMIRSNLLPIVYVQIEPGVPHVYRVELHWDRSYAWYIDNQLIDAGVPYGVYPRADSRIIWGSEYEHVDNLTRWDYVRYGTVPLDASGDYDSNDAIDWFDYYFARECFADPDYGSGPSCRFIDLNSDSHIDLADFAEFQNAFGPAK